MSDKIKRGALKAKLTTFSKFMKGIQEKQSLDEIDTIQIRERLNKIYNIIDEFEEIQMNIEEQSENIETELKERQMFEDSYYLEISLAKKVIMKYETINSTEPNTIASAYAQASNLVNIKLPTIQLPKFEGKYSNWLEFRDTYESLIHTNASINEIQKFHYLRASLEGSASEVIQSLEFTARNYAVAWAALLDRYNNNRLLVMNHVQALFNIDSISKESAESLRKIIDSVSKNLRALEQLDQPTSNWDTLIVYLITSKLDTVTLREWENYKSDKNVPNFNDLKTFLKARADLLETLNSNQAEKKQIKSSVKGFLVTEDKQTYVKCRVCQKDHYIQNCPEFLKLTTNDKHAKVMNLRLCFNCLRPGHMTKVCRKGTCKKCNSKHHTLLHIEKQSTEKENVASTSSSVALSSCLSDNYVLLSTVFIQARDNLGKMHTVRALLDSGSQSSYLTRQLSDRLRIRTSKVNITVLGLNQTTTNIESECDLEIQSLHNAFSVNLKCFVVPEIAGLLPSFPLKVTDIDIPKNIKLADPSFDKPGRVDMLIGANLFWQVLSIGQITFGRDKPILQKTRFGWIVSGPIPNKPMETTICKFTQNYDVQHQLAKFWEMEECQNERPFTTEELECEAHFKKHVSRTQDGRFVVTLPLKDSAEMLGESYEHAQKRFNALEKKLEKTPVLKKRYVEFMNEYRDLGHMSKLEGNKIEKTGYYMPHRGVVREDSLTTKLRVVFDASAPTSNGISFNNLQMTGPTIQNELFAILLRFRQYQYVIAGDIAKMYRQILVTPKQRNLQRILWREDTSSPIETFQLNTVTYGTTAAPFLAIRCLWQLAEDNKYEHPTLAEIIKSDFYVDDLLTGADDLEEAAVITKGVLDILKQGQFDLRKFYSNNNQALKYVTETHSSATILKFGENENTKTLGLTWCPVKDNLMYSISDVRKEKKITKRIILSTIAQIFDPLGLLGPCTVNAKIIMQQLWLEKLTWDESLPAHIHAAWSQFRDELPLLNHLKINRLVLCQNAKRIELHGFSDASEKAYGGCVYLRSIGEDGNAHVHLLCSKSKVAPLKTVTVPRLELSGALILARLAKKVASALRVTLTECTLWCDSTIVLAWLKISPNRLKPFVSNRVAEIQELTAQHTWRHVPSVENPADLLSRGLMPGCIDNANLWWNGPEFLKEEERFWPTKPDSILTKDQDLPDTKKIITTLHIQQAERFPVERFSKLNTLKRVVAWIIRFKTNCLKKSEESYFKCLSQNEIHNAFKKLVNLAQNEFFEREIRALENGTHIAKSSKILNLNPILDEDKLLRVGGRLENSLLTPDAKHPLLMHHKHHLARLITEEEHIRLLHAGPQQLLASLREQFWIVGGRTLVKSVVKRCMTCFRHRPRAIQPIMGQLPEERLAPSPPFCVTGIDYAGPVLIKDRKGRGARTRKCYVGVFVCFTTKAIHLELISDLTKDSFLMCLKRFIGRRGKPNQIVSDNGRNFVAAHKELKQLYDFVKTHNDDLLNACSKENIVWKFIPPYAPHFGGLWEAGVKSCKYHLKRVLGNASLTFEELNTVLVQIEAVLNSRPLCPLSSDPHDLTPLTPAHFLVGRPLVAVPDPDLQQVPENRLSRYQHLQQCHQHFWTRWHKEYLTELQQRTKWKKGTGDLKLGALVLIKEDNCPPLKWKMGRIIQLHPGKDGVTRVATVHTTTGDTKRPYSKLCSLPNEDN